MEQKNKISEAQSEYLEVERVEFQNILMNAIINLPVKSRLAFMMNRFEELTYHEIAERLDISVKTVESRMGKALRLLRESLQVTV